ncbi:sensor histidine kinase [Colwelliaceae bacterium 6441]
MTESGIEVFVDELYFYFLMMNILGFNIIFSYIYISKGAHRQLSLFKIINIGLGALLLSLPISLLVFDWGGEGGLHNVYLAFLYLLAIVLPVVWAIMLIFYIKRREAQPQFQMLKQQIAEQSLEREKVEMELQLLQAQVEPHFFFNTLANLHCLIDNQPDKAKQLLEELTDYLRRSVPLYRKKFISLEQELQLVQHYLNIQKIRFVSKLAVQIDCQPQTLSVPVLPLSIITLVENAVKHGVEKCKGNCLITLQARCVEDNYLQVKVIDDAGLFESENLMSSNGTGLNNLKARLNITYSKNAKFKLYNDKLKRTIALIEVPING